MNGLVPLINFAEIVPNLYRSGQPQYLFQYNWMWENGIRRIVNLRDELDHDSKFIGRFVPWDGELLRFDVVNIPVPDGKIPTLEQGKEFIKLIRDSSYAYHPTLIHCAYGHGRTSTFSVLAKIALGWTLAEALQDEQERFKYNFRHHAQVEWLTNNEKKLLTN